MSIVTIPPEKNVGESLDDINNNFDYLNKEIEKIYSMLNEIGLISGTYTMLTDKSSITVDMSTNSGDAIIMEEME